jgi:hypothetical protein
MSALVNWRRLVPMRSLRSALISIAISNGRRLIWQHGSHLTGLGLGSCHIDTGTGMNMLLQRVELSQYLTRKT